MSSPRRVLITGIRGQDGTLLHQQLRARGDEVHGLAQAGDGGDLDGTPVHGIDLTDPDAVDRFVQDLAPEQIYHLAGISSVAFSWEHPVLTSQVNIVGTAALLDAAWRLHQAGLGVRFVLASSAEIFGQPDISPQNENTPLAPVSPYGVSKAAAHLAVGAYRARGLGASSMILYNHESPLRPTSFVTRKITSTVAAIAQGRADSLTLGNLDARRDWGWAADYVTAMVMAAEHPEARDFVIATGVSHTVRDFVAAAFAHVGITDWQHLVKVDPAFFRPVEATELRGDASAARTVLGWEPSLGFDELVAAMVEADLR